MKIMEVKEQKQQILIAEDDEFQQLCIKTILNNAGFNPKIVDNGKKVTQEYIANPKIWKLVLLDLNMPEMDGFTACQYIRKLNKKQKILALTADSGYQTRKKCRQCGFNNIINKPFQIDSLKEYLQ